MILGAIIEKVTKQQLSTIFNQHFFQASNLNLAHSYYAPHVLSNDLYSRLVHGYNADTEVDMSKVNLSWAQSAGGIISNAEDIAQWYAFYTDLILRNPNIFDYFVNKDSGKKLLNFAYNGYGVGVNSEMTRNGVFWSTSGLTPGYISLAGRLVNHDISFAYMINSGGNARNIYQELTPQINAILMKNLASSAN